MKDFTHPIAPRRLWALVLVGLALFLAACGRGEPPVLIIPTPVMTAAPGDLPTVAPTTAGVLPSPTIMATLPTATLPLPPTVAPPIATSTASPLPSATPPSSATPPPPATSAPLPTATAVSVAPAGYQVAFVAANDTLNVRRQPSANADVVTQLPSNATGVQVIGEGESIRGGSIWLPVATSAGDGWVNSRFLTESVSREAFCGDAAVTELLDQLEEAIAEEDGKLLLELVHPDRGLRLRLNWWNEEIRVEGDDIQTLFRAQKKYDWGTAEGSGEPVRGSFSEVIMPFLEQNLLGASEWGCDQGLFGPTAGLTILPEGYEPVRFYSAHRPAPAEQELDWGTWIVGVERWEGRYYVSYLVHYRYEV